MIDENIIIYEDYPETVTDAVNQLLTVLSDMDKEEIRTTSQKDLIDLHLGLGLWIRNNFGLWDHNQALMDSCKLVAGYHPMLTIQPDEASRIIVDSLWETLQK